MPHTTLAIDIGGTNFSLAIFRNQALTHVETRATLRNAGPRWMLEQMQTIVDGWQIQHPVDGCGVGFGGPVHFAEQRVIYSTHVSGWDDFDLSGELQRIFGAPVIMDRDTLVAALGEAFHGAGVGFSSLFYVTLSTGIGGGYLDRNGLLRGPDSFACEIGHHCVDPGGPPCLCGSSGCLERMCSGLWLERDYGLSAQILLADPAFVARYVVPLARGLKNCIMFFNPARVVLGGGITRAGDALFAPLRQELARQMPPWSRARIDLVPAALERPVLWGALELAGQQLYGLPRETPP